MAVINKFHNPLTVDELCEILYKEYHVEGSETLTFKTSIESFCNNAIREKLIIIYG